MSLPVKIPALALALAIGCATPRPAPLAFRAANAPEVLELSPVLSNGQFSAWYSWPASTPTNAVWIPESSSNLVDWVHAPEWCQLPDRAGRAAGLGAGLPRMTDTTPGTAALFFRVRRQGLPRQ